MFGNLEGMMNKLKDAQQKIEETKQRLNTVLIDEIGAEGKLKITVTANSEIKTIAIDESLLNDNEELEDYLVITLNKALSRAASVNEQEMKVVAKGGMPNIPGIDGLF